MKTLVYFAALGFVVNASAQPKSSGTVKIQKEESANSGTSLLINHPRSGRTIISVNGQSDNSTYEISTKGNDPNFDLTVKSESRTADVEVRHGLNDSFAVGLSVDVGQSESSTSVRYQGADYVGTSRSKGLSGPSLIGMYKGTLTSNNSLVSRISANIPVGDHRCNESESERTSSGSTITECDRMNAGYSSNIQIGIENKGSLYTGIGLTTTLNDLQTTKNKSERGVETENHTSGGNSYGIYASIEKPGTTFTIGGALVLAHSTATNSSSNTSNSSGTYNDYGGAMAYGSVLLMKDVQLAAQLTYRRMLREEFGNAKIGSQSAVLGSFGAIIGL